MVVKRKIPLRGMDVYYMADVAMKYPGIYDNRFMLSLIDFFSEKEMEEYAENIVKRSKFYKNDSLENIELLYKLGILYNDMGNMKKMKKVMLRVKKINPGYKKVNYYLTN